MTDRELLEQILALVTPTDTDKALMERWGSVFTAYPEGSMPLQVFLKTLTEIERHRLFDLGWGQDALRRTKIQSWIFEATAMGYVDPNSERTAQIRELIGPTK